MSRLSARQRDWSRVILVFGIFGGLMYMLDPNDRSWWGCWALVAMLAVFTRLPRDAKMNRVVKAWLGLVLVVFTGGLVVLALDLGFDPYWVAVYTGVGGAAVERLQLFHFELRDLWAGNPKDEKPVNGSSWLDRSAWINPDQPVPGQREGVS